MKVTLKSIVINEYECTTVKIFECPRITYNKMAAGNQNEALTRCTAKCVAFVGASFDE